MALLEIVLKSQSLRRNVAVSVVLPTDRNYPAGSEPWDARPYKTMYLLHGLHGDSLSWVTGSRIRRWAEERDLAVVMPSGENGFYVDQPRSYDRYGEYIGRELVELTRRMFPLSSRREDTFIAGLSMGGFGAIRNGLKYHETFGYIAGLSSALILEHALGLSYDATDITQDRAYFESCFGDLEAAMESDNNPRFLVRALRERAIRDSSIRFPGIYLACGTEDGLIEANRSFRDFLGTNGINLTYEEGPGFHDWDFWDFSIRHVLDWLPLSRPDRL